MQTPVYPDDMSSLDARQNENMQNVQSLMVVLMITPGPMFNKGYKNVYKAVAGVLSSRKKKDEQSLEYKSRKSIEEHSRECRLMVAKVGKSEEGSARKESG
jgi:hypothetical protein